MRRALLPVVLVAIALALPIPALAHPPPTSGSRVLLVVVPPAEALEAQGAFGIGVLPRTRALDAFIAAIARVHPRGADQELVRRLVDARVAVDVHGGGFPGFATAAPPEPAGGVLTVARAGDLSAAEIDSHDLALVLGSGGRSPVVVVRTGRSGVLVSASTRREALVTPYDVAATVLASFGAAPPKAVAAAPLRVEPVADPVARVRALASRIDRDDAYGGPLTAVTVLFAFPALVAALLLRHRPPLAAALLRGASLAPAGYVAGVFVPTETWWPRALAVAAAFVAGVVWRAASARRFVAVALVANAAAVVSLAVVAAVRPNGSLASALWGDPLDSWRFFGLSNRFTAFLAGGVVVGALLLAPRLWAYAAGVIVAVAAASAPGVGANFVAALTLSFGATLGGLVLWRRRVEWWHPVAGVVAGSAALVVAMLSDAAAPVSHGGHAVGSIRDGGLGAAWRIFLDRARFNVDTTTDITVVGPIAFVAVAAILVALLVRAWRASFDRGARAAIAGGAAAALATLFVEDSGFLAGMIVGFYPALAFVVVAVTERRAPAGVAPATTPAPRG